MYPRLRKFLLIFFLLLLVISFFLKQNYKNIDNILPELLEEPKQTALIDAELIEFEKDGFAYKLKPIADYEINALVVNRMDYRFFSIKNSDSIFPVDLCLVWGSNLKEKSYQNKSLSFSQDYRFCLYNWRGGKPINTSEVSNNHLISNDEKIISAITKIKASDQIRITGYLVDLEANKVGEISNYDYSSFTLNSSVTRGDGGAGACEVVYVTNIEILQTGHPFLSFLHSFSLYAVLLLVLIAIWRIFK